ncbi:MAG: NAD-dependent epimerase/dehydratase family protein [Thermovirgaceae bacterium]
MKIAVTGGAGFIGSHIVDALVDAGNEVLIIDDLSTGKEDNINPKAAFEQCDIQDEAAVDRLFARFRPEIVDHHAAQIDIRKSVADPAFDARVNVVGSIVLLKTAAKHGVKGFIFASTGGAIYGETPVAAREESPKSPISPYGAAKASVEHYLYVYGRTYGLPTAALRYGNVYGPRQDPRGEAGVISIFAEKLLAGERPTIFGTGEQVRDYVYVGDVAAANLLAIDHLRRNPAACVIPDEGAFNIGTGTSTSVNDLHRLLAEAAGGPKEAIHGDARPGELMESRLDVTRARETLGFSAGVDLKRGIRSVVDWLKGMKAEG